MLTTASAAAAQSYLVDGPNPVVFAPLPTTATKLTVPLFSGANVVLPFTFSFFRQPVTSVTMSLYGYLVLADGSAGESTNTDIPQVVVGSIPPTFIAPWWDQLTENGTYRYLVSGDAPLRNVAFEWSASGGVFQVQLFESTGQIRFTYGPMAPLTSSSASVGVQRQLGTGLAALSCTPGCAGADWPANRAIDFYTPADLRVARSSVDESGYAGVSYRASATIRNEGGHEAKNVTVRFYLSTDALFSAASDAPLGDAVLTSVAALSEQTVTTSVLTIPPATAAGGYFIFAEVDPANAIVETDETNNVGSPASMTVAAPKGDVVVASMVAPSAVAPGAMLMIDRTLRNAGNAAVGAFKYSWLLSDNAAVSVSDRALGVSSVAGLNAQQNQTARDVVALPFDVKPGRYWLGLCVNFDAADTALGFGLDEISYLNNCFTPAQVTVVSNGMLSVLTSSLDAATQFGSYGVALEATGGSGAYTWSLTGALPPGLTLSPSGFLSGSPAVSGSFSFEVTVASEALSSTQNLSLDVASGDLPLALVAQSLPSAQFSRPYRVALVAVGGKAPYRWSASTLPVGLALSPQGVLEGRASEQGVHSIVFTVTDSAAASDSREVSISVVEPPNLAIATVALPSALLNRDFAQALTAVGGRAPYDWSLTRFQQLPENPTDVRGPVLAGFPPKFGVSLADGVLRGTPALAGLYSLTFEVRDSTGTKDSATVVWLVSYETGLAITTTQLPDAFVNQLYSVKLLHTGAGTPVTFSAPCIEEATRPDEPYTCAAREPNAQLPVGLTLMSDGTISGQPSSATGSYTFLVKVADASGRQDTRGFSIRVQPDFASGQRGCNSVPGLELGLLLLLMRRRR